MENQKEQQMDRHAWYLRSLVIGAVLLFVTPFELPPNSLSAPRRQAGNISEIRWEFDSGG